MVYEQRENFRTALCIAARDQPWLLALFLDVSPNTYLNSAGAIRRRLMISFES